MSEWKHASKLITTTTTNTSSLV
jgi:valyl-tRNA synthetase